MAPINLRRRSFLQGIAGLACAALSGLTVTRAPTAAGWRVDARAHPAVGGVRAMTVEVACPATVTSEAFLWRGLYCWRDGHVLPTTYQLVRQAEIFASQIAQVRPVHLGAAAFGIRVAMERAQQTGIGRYPSDISRGTFHAELDTRYPNP